MVSVSVSICLASTDLIWIMNRRIIWMDHLSSNFILFVCYGYYQTSTCSITGYAWIWQTLTAVRIKQRSELRPILFVTQATFPSILSVTLSWCNTRTVYIDQVCTTWTYQQRRPRTDQITAAHSRRRIPRRARKLRLPLFKGHAGESKKNPRLVPWSTSSRCA